MLIPLAEATSATSGGKAAVLGRLARAGLPVPSGFVVPLATYRAATAGFDLATVVATQGPDTARRLVESLPARPSLLDALDKALARLGDPPVAVRSSVTTEDTAEDSAAGQHDTFLGVHGAPAVADRLRACWASLWSERAVAYRSTRGTTAAPEAAVLVQRHVDADVAGVLFTDPAGTVVVEASWGLGESVVQGLVTPDSWTVADGVVTRSTGSKATRVDLRGEHVVTREVSDVDRRRPCLDDATVRRLAALGGEVSALLGGPQDVEWAVEDGEIWLLQARPVTAGLPARPAPGTPPGTQLTGTPGSGGTATGPARIVRGPGDFGTVQPGDVLVCRYTDPAWTPLFGVVAAVVTETGGVLSHAAIVAREHGIPAVLAVPGALTTLHDGLTVVVDGTAGTVRAERSGYGAVMQYTVRVTREDEWWVAEVAGIEDATVRTQEWAQLNTEVRSLIADLTGAWPDDVEIEWVEA